MSRLFDEHIKRKTYSLDGAWRFAVDRGDFGEKENWFNGLPHYETVAVPSVWNLECGLFEYEGAAWYEKEFYTEGGCLRFCFGGVMTEAKVWLDGVYIGSHYGGFLQFSLTVPKVAEGYHRLTVRADNRFDEHSIPQKVVDWYHFGGIIRGVSVETLKGISILSNHLEYTLSDDLKSVTGHFSLELYNAESCEISSEIRLSIGENNVGRYAVTLGSNEHKSLTTADFTLDSIRLWDVLSPELYYIKAQSDTDDLFDRVGFRSIEVRDGKLLLNGKETELCGVNRHEEHPDFGFAFPMARMKHDIDLALDLGCNTIRGSHYPNSQAFVDYLDECGILFWSEIPIWGGGFSTEALGDELVLERGLNMHREMVKYYYNHPSVIFWGMHNEIRSDTDEGYNMSKLYYEYLKSNGGNRLVIYASDKPMTDICLEFSDVTCINMYYGWYRGGIEIWPKFLDEFCVRRKELGLNDRPIIFSEFGAGAIYGFRDTECVKWSEDYQVKVLDYCLKLFHEHPDVCGSYIWQFADIRTSEEMGYTRARGFNNKGILNENRRPKAAYYAVKSCYRSFMEETK